MLSDDESSELLDLAELLVDSGNISDDVLDEWRRECLLTEDHADVGSCSVVQVGSPAVGSQTSHQPPSLLGSGGEYASASPLAEVWLLVANQWQGDGIHWLGSRNRSRCRPPCMLALTPAGAGTDASTCDRCSWARRKYNVSQVKAHMFS